jgi:hypothetical protein
MAAPAAWPAVRENGKKLTVIGLPWFSSSNLHIGSEFTVSASASDGSAGFPTYQYQSNLLYSHPIL